MLQATIYKRQHVSADI